MIRTLLTASLIVLASCAPAAFAGPEDFHAGTVITEFGRVASAPDAPALAEDTVFKVAFDIGKGADEGKVNRNLESAARFINMHAEAGIPVENIQVAIVVHGSAAMDIVTDTRLGKENTNAPLVAALIDAGASIELCGQTAAYRDVAKEDLLPGVDMSLSAMTAHALLQQDGYTLNPF